MKMSKRVNAVRRNVMGGLTRNVGKSYTISEQDPSKIKRILISRPNHRLGNLLLLSPLVQEVINTFPDAKIDLFVKGGITPFIYQNYKNIDRIIQLPKKPFSNVLKYANGWSKLKGRKYDLVINSTLSSSSGRLSTSFARGDNKIFGSYEESLDAKYPDYRHNAKTPVYNFREYLKNSGFETSSESIPFLDIKLTEAEKADGKAKLLKLTSNSKKTICLFTNATGAKIYSEEWWSDLYQKLESKFPDYNIVELLPVENISKLNFKIPSFYSTDIREMGGFIANCTVFLAADNGVMHLASAVNTPTVGFFKVTGGDVYGPYNNGSFSVNTNETPMDGILERLSQSLSKI